MAVEGDDVVVRCRVSGTHRGVGRLPVDGGELVGAEPPGNRFEVRHVHRYTVGVTAAHRRRRDPQPPDLCSGTTMREARAGGI